MNVYLVMGTIAVWIIYGIIIKLTKKRKYDYSILVAFVFLLGLGYFYFYKQMDSEYYMYFSYTTIALFAFWLIVDNLLLLFKKNVSEFDFYDLELELEHLSSASELLRRRFISTIELTNDGISFRDEGIIFGTDKYLAITGLKENEFSVGDFRSIVHKDDLPQYDMKLEKVTKKYPTYTIKYRVKKEGKYLWISEQGKLLIVNKKRTYITTIKTMDIRKFPESDVDVLNMLPDYKEMYTEMQKLSKQQKSYNLVIIQLTNIPIINEKYGRDFGDLMMGEYLSKLRYKFIKDSKSLFRINGIKFGLIIKDKAKYDLLDRALVGTGELLTLRLQFGGVTQTIYPNLGISESLNGTVKPDVVVSEANEALMLTLREDCATTFSFYNKKKCG